MAPHMKKRKRIAEIVISAKDEKQGRWMCYRCGRVEVSSYGDICSYCDNK